jgi:hypothetical protein
MGHPYKKPSPLKVGGLFGLTSKIIPEGAKVIEKAKDLTFDDVVEAGINVGSLGLRGAAGVASMMLNTNSAYGGTYSDDPRFKMQFQDQVNDGGLLPEYNNADTALPSPVDKVAKTTKGKGRNFRSADEGAGMTEKGVKEYKKENPGSKLQTAVTGDVKPGSKAYKRRKSFCARSKGWTGERGKAARKRWKC